MVKMDKLPSGKWRARIHLGGGKYKTITGADKKDVQLKAAEFEAGQLKETAATRESIALGEIIDKYIASKTNVLSPSTIRGYLATRRSMFPELMSVSVDQITSECVQNAINEEAITKSPKYIANECGLMSAALKMFAPDIRLNIKTPQRLKSEIEVPTEDEVKQIINSARNADIELPVILAACCGLRRSEILGLKWKDIDAEKRTISINEAIVTDKDNNAVSKGTKTYAGTRVIRVFPFVLETIQRAERVGEYVVNLKGYQIYNRFENILKDCKLPHYRFHDLRHYCVSVMLSLNIPKNYIADYVGHETENMIDKVYGHIMASKKTSVEDQMQDYFESVMKSVTKK